MWLETRPRLCRERSSSSQSCPNLIQALCRRALVCLETVSGCLTLHGGWGSVLSLPQFAIWTREVWLTGTKLYRCPSHNRDKFHSGWAHYQVCCILPSQACGQKTLTCISANRSIMLLRGTGLLGQTSACTMHSLLLKAPNPQTQNKLFPTWKLVDLDIMHFFCLFFVLKKKHANDMMTKEKWQEREKRNEHFVPSN